LLKENIGYPYTMLSDQMFHHAGAGYAGQGTLCGSVGASSAIINLVAKDKKNSHLEMVTDLINWYASFDHPTDEFDGFCRFPGQKRLPPNSPLCHVSSSTWVTAAGVSIDSKERKDRCSKVAGRVAMQTVMMLNDYVDGKFVAAAPAMSEHTASCMDCHGPEADDNQQGRMNCNLCHTQTEDHTL